MSTFILASSCTVEMLLQFVLNSSMFVEDVDIEQVSDSYCKINVRLTPVFYDRMRQQYVIRMINEVHRLCPFLEHIEVLTYRGKKLTSCE